MYSWRTLRHFPPVLGHAAGATICRHFLQGRCAFGSPLNTGKAVDNTNQTAPVPVRAAVLRGDACRNLHTMPEPALPAVANGQSRGPGPGPPGPPGPRPEAATARVERPRPRCSRAVRVVGSQLLRFCLERPVEEFTECGICFENAEPLSFCVPTREQAKLDLGKCNHPAASIHRDREEG